MGEIEVRAPDEVVPVEQAASLSLVHASDPTEFVQKATEIARALNDVIEQRELYKTISGRKHLLYEAWTFLGSMMGAFGNPVFAVEDWTREYRDPDTGAVIGWEARVIAKTGDGREVGAAESMCTRKESTWKSRDDYAIRSMAQTRAASKALRQPLGFVVQLAGYNPTPAEEMDERESQRPFDPGKDLMPGAIKGGEGLNIRIAEGFNSIDSSVGWGEILKQIPGERDEAFWRRIVNAHAKLVELWGGGFPPPEAPLIQQAFAWAFEGVTVVVTYKEPEPKEEVVEGEVVADPPARGAYWEPGDGEQFPLPDDSDLDKIQFPDR